MECPTGREHAQGKLAVAHLAADAPRCSVRHLLITLKSVGQTIRHAERLSAFLTCLEAQLYPWPDRGEFQAEL